MAKAGLDKIFKNGDDFKIRSLGDMTEEERKRFQECRKRQDECLTRKKVHPHIWNFRITI